MATFKAIVKAKRKDGFFPVYIRVAHRRKLAYIATDKFVKESVLSRNGEIEDPYVMQYCTRKIIEYVEALNKVDTEHWTVRDVVNYLNTGEADISFSDYARKHIDRMAERGQKRNARNYEMALNHLERYAGTTAVKFSQLTSSFVNEWLNTLATTRRAKDNAYIEMRVPSILLPLFEKYATSDDDPFLFSFHERYRTSDSLGSNANSGIKKICESLGITSDDRYCVYTFRHTWGTIAQNDCGATISEVAFAMNHASGHEVTRGYLKLDFSPAWRLNEKVVELIFFTATESEKKDPEDSLFRFSSKHLIHGSAYFRGNLLGEVEDTGFNNIDEVIQALVPFVPDEVPMRSMVQFKIDIIDKDLSQTYERMKGKGF